MLQTNYSTKISPYFSLAITLKAIKTLYEKNISGQIVLRRQPWPVFLTNFSLTLPYECKQGALASTTGTATKTPQINNLIGRVRKISVLHVWHAIMNKPVPSSAKRQREITMFTVLMTT